MLKEEIIFGELSWVLENDSVRIAITQRGAQAAPMAFRDSAGCEIQPYCVTPWQEEACKPPAGMPESMLRGDFFCLPFGEAEQELMMSAHGRTSSELWSRKAFNCRPGVQALCIHMQEAIQNAAATRYFFLRDGETVVYDLAVIDGLDGEFTIGHHAILRVPEQDEALLISTSEVAAGRTFPALFVDRDNGEQQGLAIDAEFSDLRRVPAFRGDGSTVDCSRYPTRRGCSDLLQLALEAKPGMLAWTAAVNTEEGYLRYSLRDAGLLPSTILWIENCARRSSPWNGRTRLLGIEDVCTYFNLGSEQAREPNSLSRRGIKTVQRFSTSERYLLPYIQGAIRVPKGFGRVQRMEKEAQGVSFIDENGVRIATRVQTDFAVGNLSAFMDA
ncbi:MAG: hypothetical protein P4L03_05885 [Terracidiphilus sp.]|nr:hypothetical protein [Terracidiphilus sp.]